MDNKMSNQEQKYVYLPMPVTFEEKRAWNAKGYKVADIAFMPEGYDNAFKPAGVKQENQSKTKPR